MNNSKNWKSIAKWPEYLGLQDNESSDDHYSEEETRGVCKLLVRHGFGGDGKVFPTNLYIAEFKDDKLVHAHPYQP